MLHWDIHHNLYPPMDVLLSSHSCSYHTEHHHFYLRDRCICKSNLYLWLNNNLGDLLMGSGFNYWHHGFACWVELHFRLWIDSGLILRDSWCPDRGVKIITSIFWSVTYIQSKHRLHTKESYSYLPLYDVNQSRLHGWLCLKWIVWLQRRKWQKLLLAYWIVPY